jgi:tRNA(fMet)-specific endonuclease VapC
MAGIYLLDTNAAIALNAGDPALLEKLQEADEVFVPAIVLGELYFGAEKSGRAEENRQRVDTLADRWTIHDCDSVTAQHYGRIKNQLRTLGRPIPENDIWIAALARQHDLVLVTKDQHFSHVEGLKSASW